MEDHDEVAWRLPKGQTTSATAIGSRRLPPRWLYRGWTLTSLPLASHPLERRRQLRWCASADVVILQRKLLPLWQLRVLRKAARKLIYDFDDALFHRDSYSPKGPVELDSAGALLGHNLCRRRRDRRQRLSAVGSLELHRAGIVHWVPTCVNPEIYRLANHERRNSASAWCGSASEHAPGPEVCRTAARGRRRAIAGS